MRINAESKSKTYISVWDIDRPSRHHWTKKEFNKKKKENTSEEKLLNRKDRFFWRNFQN